MEKLQFIVHPPTIAQNSILGRLSYTKDELNLINASTMTKS
jgi:hypothetical protein